jgi:hypothetical protein
LVDYVIPSYNDHVALKVYARHKKETPGMFSLCAMSFCEWVKVSPRLRSLTGFCCTFDTKIAIKTLLHNTAN